MPPRKNNLPPENNGIQYNFCKNPKCNNYGVEPTDDTVGNKDLPYSINYAGKGMPILVCNLCKETPPLKSNAGIHEEIERLMAHMQPVEVLTCPDVLCKNHLVPVGTKKAYRAYGKTAQGAKRYRCNECGKTFSQARPMQGQRDTHHNIDIFKMLVNKVPLSRIIAMLGISWELLYNRIDFIHSQCQRFSANREKRLSDMEIEKLYISIDRQDHVLNWAERKDKRNVVLSAITSVDNSTGYVFGVHPNFDASLDRNAIEAFVSDTGDDTLPLPLRKTARLWIGADYIQNSKVNKRQSLRLRTIDTEIDAQYKDFSNRLDLEAFDIKSAVEKLPNYGMQIHAEYTMIAHFYCLKKLMGNVKKWRFFLDQEAGIRAAVLAAFKGEVKNHTAEAFYVSISKELTVDEKRQLTDEAKINFKKLKEAYPKFSDSEVKLELLKNEIYLLRHIGQWKDKWVNHPLPDMSEPEKAMC